MKASAVTVKVSRQAPPARWLLLIHQIPPKPDYFRVKVRRRLQRMGAVALKNSVYVLPSRDDTLEDFRWLLREIVAEGGEATLCEAELVEGITRAELEGMFASERDAEYAALVTAAQGLANPGDALGDEARTAGIEPEVGHLRQRMDQIGALDFFGATGRRGAERAIATLEARLRRPREAAGDSAQRG